MELPLPKGAANPIQDPSDLRQQMGSARRRAICCFLRRRLLIT
jgi:hypothetical protein